MSAPKVSVIIPTFNRAALLSEALDSVFAQSFKDFEIIVVDDGSTDDTAERMREYEGRVRYCRQENAGVNAARNRGLTMAQGAYIALLDSDDLWVPGKLDVQVQLLDRFPDVAFVFSDFFIFNGIVPQPGVNAAPKGLATWFEHVSDRLDPYVQSWPLSSLSLPAVGALQTDECSVFLGDVYAASLVCPYVLPSTALIRRAAIPPGLSLPEFDSTCGDWDFFARLSKAGRALYLDAETTFNRSHEDAVRLTRVEATIQLERRVAMIDRIWRADREFAADHELLMDRIQRMLFLKLAKKHLFASRHAEARAALRRAARLSGSKSSQERLLNVLVRLPGSGHLLHWSRATLHAMRRISSARMSGE